MQQLDDLNSANQLLADSINTIDGRNLASLRTDFNEARANGFVMELTDDTEVVLTPSECQQSTHDARQDVIDECNKISDSMTFGNWLQSQLDSACLDLEQDSASKIGLASMMMTPVQTEIDNLY